MKATALSATALVVVVAALARAEDELYDCRDQMIAVERVHTQSVLSSAPAHTPSSMSSAAVDGFLAQYTFADAAAGAAFVRDAEAAGTDVWHAGLSHADVFHPSAAPSGAARVQPIFLAATPPPPTRFDYALEHLNSSYHASYHRLGDINDLVAGLERQAPELVSRVTYGHSFEGRPLEVVHVRNASAQTKASVVVIGSQHAREWIATAAATYLLHALVTPANETGSLRSLLEHHDFYIIPTPNPDGYDYTWTTDRLWHKNRQTTGAARRCTGIDLARNWGYKWKRTASGPGFSSESDLDDEEEDDVDALRRRQSASDTCAPGYPGLRPFEAPETSALDVLLRGLPAVGAFVELRAYGQLVSAPFAHSCKRTPKDAEDQLELASGAAHVAMKAHGAAYAVGRACDQVLRAGGSALDYVYSAVGVKYAYTVRLRDTGTYGYALPAEMIRPVGEETAEMVAYLARFMRERAA